METSVPCAAIMQPYIFPYIGYFHLIEASDHFVFYDDVNYITRGWINRNRILSQGSECLFSVPVRKASQNKLILETSPLIDAKWKSKFTGLLSHSYRKSPFFKDVIPVVMGVFDSEYKSISDLAVSSISAVYDYLGEDFQYSKSSIISPASKGMEKSDRLAHVTKELGFDGYVNAAGGKELYSKTGFQSKGVSLHFVSSMPVVYQQFGQDFVPWLSIIDVLMFNSKDSIKEFFSAYTLD